MPVVTFLPSGRTYSVIERGTLLRAARRARMGLASSCRGKGVCKACRVRIVSGAEHLSEPTQLERDAAREAGLDPDERLACLARVLGPVAVTTSYW